LIWLLWLLLILGEVVLGHQSVVFDIKFAILRILGYLEQRLGGGESGFDGDVFAHEFHFVVQADDPTLLEGLNVLFAYVSRLIVKQAVRVL